MKTIEQLKDIETELGERVTETHLAARAFDSGDHWQDGKGFLPFAYMDAADKTRLEPKIKQTFSSEDVIPKVVTNEQNGVLGRNPDWQAVASVPKDVLLSKAEQEANEKLEKELDAALIADWDNQHALDEIKEAERMTATMKTAVARAYVPSGLRLPNGQLPRVTDLAEAMSLLHIEILTADKAGVFYDADTKKPFGVFVSEKDGVKKYELTFVDDEGKTHIHIISKSQYDQLAEATLPSLRDYLPQDTPESIDDSFEPVDLGGELFYFELDRMPLITEAVMSCQKSVNLNHSMQDRNTWQHGSRAVVAMNVQPPMEETGLKNPDGTPELRKVPINLDGSAVNLLNGVPVYDTDDAMKQKIIGFADPDFMVVEPSEPDVFIKGIESKSAAIYRMVHQEHIELAESANLSGKSREESRVGFEKSEKALARKLDAYGRWRLKIKTKFAAFVTGREKDFSDFRFEFSCTVDAGTPSAEIRTQASNDVKDGKLSLPTYLSEYCGREDAAAEVERLEASEMHQLALAKSRLETAKLARDLGLPPEFVVEYLSIEDETQKNALVASLQEKQEQQAQERQAAMNGNGFAK